MDDAEELDVDWTLVDWFLSLTPLERLQTVESYARLMFATDQNLREQYGYDRLPEDPSDAENRQPDNREKERGLKPAFFVYMSKASASNLFCSMSCASWLPVAGLADSTRPTYFGRILPSKNSTRFGNI